MEREREGGRDEGKVSGGERERATVYARLHTGRHDRASASTLTDGATQEAMVKRL